MKTENWLRRKYPEHADQLLNDFSIDHLNDFKKRGKKLGKFNVDWNRNWDDDVSYPAGTLCFFNRANPVNDYNYPLTSATVKSCKEGLTPSGYHSIQVYNYEVDLI